MKKDLPNKKTQGMTLIEMILAMALIAILFSSMLNIVRVNSTKMGIMLEAKNFTALLRDQQNKAMSIKKDSSSSNETVCYYSFRLNGSAYQIARGYTNSNLVSGCASASQTAWDTVRNLPSDFEITSSVGYCNNPIRFEVPYGGVNWGNSPNFDDSCTYTISPRTPSSRRDSIDFQGHYQQRFLLSRTPSSRRDSIDIKVFRSGEIKIIE